MKPPDAAPVPILRRRGGRGGAPRQVRFEDPPADGGAPPGSPPLQPLSVPTLRSSLWLRGGPASPEPFDAARAAAALLGASFGARCAVGAAAAGATNVPPAQRLFRGLLGLSAPPPRPPRRAAPPEPPPKTPGPEPGGAELGGIPALCETPWLPPLAAPPWGPPRPLPRPPGASFVPYRKLQQWGGAPELETPAPIAFDVIEARRNGACGYPNKEAVGVTSSRRDNARASSLQSALA